MNADLTRRIFLSTIGAPLTPRRLRPEIFRFIDLFAGIGGLRSGFDAMAGNVCSPANGISSRDGHTVQLVLRWVGTPIQLRYPGHYTSNLPDISEDQAYASINASIPTMMYCSPVSHASRSVLPVSEKELIGQKTRLWMWHPGDTFFDVARIIRAKQPAIFVLENVKIWRATIRAIHSGSSWMRLRTRIRCRRLRCSRSKGP